MNISDEAVEAAAKAYFRGHNWESLVGWYREQCLEFARAALEAAAPYIVAQTANAIADGMQAWAGDAERSYVQGFAESATENTNPYRSQS